MKPESRLWPAIVVLAHDPGPPAAFEERLLLALDGLEAVALDSPDDGRTWRAYFTEVWARDAAMGEIVSALGDRASVRSVEVEDEGWALKVQEDLKAVRVGRIVVAPPWDVPSLPASTRASVDGGNIVLVVEPSMGFGTGHHQSTRLCLEALQALDLGGAHVIDVGTGSGVLALAAARLGAGRIVAIDNDPDAVAAARANAQRNGLGDAVQCEVDDVASTALAPADVVTANLTAWVLRRNAPALAALVRPRGAMVASGFTHDQVTLVSDAFRDFVVEAQRSEDDWVSLTLRRRQPCPTP